MGIGKGGGVYFQEMRGKNLLSQTMPILVSWSSAVPPDMSFIDKREMQRWAREALTDNEVAGSHSFV
jgi:hypothetical protein